MCEFAVAPHSFPGGDIWLPRNRISAPARTLFRALFRGAIQNVPELPLNRYLSSPCHRNPES
ncbi:hypothetical protein MIZ01_0844 [Sideroxyarcus emersonii]|uniref:Uncharacterized protein n=1 Tax=Sideroxyarcus emersonii TaxID=2764705 RepID=A0AAN1X9H9_9PROT|nr:hypothetical protein MIZ01_0844 [Sideroxyarcus emersonii]